jgi:hypothetical protein
LVELVGGVRPASRIEECIVVGAAGRAQHNGIERNATHRETTCGSTARGTRIGNAIDRASRRVANIGQIRCPRGHQSRSDHLNRKTKKTPSVATPRLI